jgi:hypothetical protein|tara:strand:+ start:205 stop:480 length:276 start_codon:yes stop_codon:yes gene_type:complete
MTVINVKRDVEINKVETYIIPHNGRDLKVKIEVFDTSNEKSYQDKEWLLENYSEQGRSMANIAQQFGVTPMTIQGWLRKHGIQTRSRGRKS